MRAQGDTTAHPSNYTCKLAKMRCPHTFYRVFVASRVLSLGAIFVATKIAYAAERTSRPNFSHRKTHFNPAIFYTYFRFYFFQNKENKSQFLTARSTHDFQLVVFKKVSRTLISSTTNLFVIMCSITRNDSPRSINGGLCFELAI